MRLVRRDGQFWVGNRLGASVRARWGTAGAVRERTSQFKSGERAAAEQSRLISQLEGLGFVREIPSAVVEALQHDPRDARCLSVLGDELLARGDLRGELVALAARGRPDECGGFVERNARKLWREAADDVEGEYLEATWHGGFVHGATLDEFANTRGPTVRELVDRLRDAPVAALVRSLTLKPADDERDFAAAIDLLATLPHPEVLAVLRVDSVLFSSLPPPATVQLPLELFPALRELHLRGPFDLGAFHLPRLTQFSCTDAASADGLKPLESHPTLEALTFGYAQGGPLEGALASVLPNLPALKHLSLEVTLTRAAFEFLLRLPAWRHLEGLNLRWCKVEGEDWMSGFVKKNPGAFAHLKEFAPPLARDSEQPAMAFRGLPNLVADEALPSWIQRW